jgi:hypothetical protein
MKNIEFNVRVPQKNISEKSYILKKMKNTKFEGGYFEKNSPTDDDYIFVSN